jgi:2-iminoacetate synthase
MTTFEAGAALGTTSQPANHEPVSARHAVPANSPVEASSIAAGILPPLQAEGALRPRDWVKTVIKQDEIDRYLNPDGSDFIDDALISRLVGEVDAVKAGSRPEPSLAQVREILAKSRQVKSLSLEEAAVLMSVRSPETWAEMVDSAAAIKKKVYDNRIVTFAPLYMSSRCVNSCTYCGFRAENGEMVRRRLTMDEIKNEATALTRDFGHKRLVVVFGEHPDSDVDYMVNAIDTVYSVSVPTRKGNANIRRVNVNAAPMSIEKLTKLQEVGMGTFQVFQETYHRATYAKAHPAGTIKGNYRWRLYAMHRAMEAGIDDVGIGALFGLADWRFELLGLLSHSRELEAKFNGIGAHTISFPRLEAASNAPGLDDKKWRVSDEDFLKIITLLRLCVPYTGLICTARETKEIRNEAMKRGITQMDASTRIGLGAYSEGDKASSGTGSQDIDNQQFMLGDTRSLEELIGDLADMGHITSFCTAGYRVGRTGDRIMRMLRDCSEGSLCKLNAIITFREWVDDFASPAVRAKCEALIQREFAEAKNKLPQFMPKFEPMYQKTVHGCRDLYL